MLSSHFYAQLCTSQVRSKLQKVQEELERLRAADVEKVRGDSKDKPWVLGRARLQGASYLSHARVVHVDHPRPPPPPHTRADYRVPRVSIFLLVLTSVIIFRPIATKSCMCRHRRPPPGGTPSLQVGSSVWGGGWVWPGITFSHDGIT